jgi:ABC-type antimicrobial peptide transport system permease subunit
MIHYPNSIQNYNSFVSLFFQFFKKNWGGVNDYAQAASQVVRLPVSISLSLAATAMGLSVIIGCAIGYVTGRRISKIKPADILRQL